MLLTTADDSIEMGNMHSKIVIERMKQSEFFFHTGSSLRRARTWTVTVQNNDCYSADMNEGQSNSGEG